MSASRALIVGLSGGIATGKSLALKELNRLGARTISADAIAREALCRGGGAYRPVIAAFGRGILKSNGEIDRGNLGRLVFSSPASRRELERLTHPVILREISRRLSSGKPGEVWVADVPLLFEKGRQKFFDATLLVSSGRSRQISRIMKRDGLSRVEAMRRIAAQWPLRRKERLADVVVRNEAGKARFLHAVREYYRALWLIASAAGKSPGKRSQSKVS